MRNDWKTAWLKGLLRALLCLAIALAASFLALTALAWVRGEKDGLLSALGRAAGQAWRAGIQPLLLGPWQGKDMADVREAAAEGGVLLLAGLSFGVSLRAGRLNLGAPGQYALGVLSAWGCAAAGHMPWYVCLMAGMAAGAAAGLISAWARRYARIADGAADLLMDVIAMYGAYAALQRITPGAPGDLPLIPALAGEGPLARPVTLALVLAAGLALMLWTVESRTVLGYRLRLLGASEAAAAYAGGNVRRGAALCLAVSGALAGLAGGCGALSGMAQSVSALDAGLAGLSAALLSGGHPLGAALAAGVCTHLRSGCRAMGAPFDSGLAGWLIYGALIPACACWLRALGKRRSLRLQREKEAAL